MTVEITPDAPVALAPGYRLQWEPAQQSYVLLFPEGMVTLSESANEILNRCDGRTVGELIHDLKQQFPEADLDSDVKEFMEVAHGEGWIRFG